MKACTIALLLGTLVPAAAPALAEEAPDPGPLRGDYASIGIGAAYAPSYEGSNDYNLTPAAIVRGRVSGFNFFSRATALYLDLVGGDPDAKTDILLGPMANVRFDRSSRIGDEAVKLLGELDLAIEAGAFAGVAHTGVLHAYDTIQARLDFVHDVTGTHNGYVVTPNLEYGTPLSRKAYVGASISGEFASGEFADTYYSVDAAGTLSSGLRTFDADGGFKNASLTLLGVHHLTGDLTSTGLALFAVASYSRLFGDFADSPLVADVGNRNQYFAAAGLSYTF
jgi:MipA family protein